MYRRIHILPLLALVAACDAMPSAPVPIVPTSPPESPAAPLVAVACRGDVAARSVTCSAPAGGAPAASGDLLVGGQNLYVTLAGSNLQVYADTFAFDMTVKNLIPQALGTTDGVSVDPAGVRVFFHAGPTVTGGSGQIEVANPDGFGTFTNSNQPYFQYGEVLAPQETSAPRRWKLQLDASVTSFSFTLYVSAPVEYPSGWIDVEPATLATVAGDSVQLTAVVRDALGRALTGQTIAWASDDSMVARVNPAGGGLRTMGDGSATVTASSGPRSGSMSVSVTTPTRYVVTLDHSAITAGDTVAVTAQLVDGLGNPLAAAGRVVTWSASPAGGAFTQPATQTDAAGIARVRFRSSTTVGVSHTVTATDAAGLTGTSPTVLTTGGQVVPVF